MRMHSGRYSCLFPLCVVRTFQVSMSPPTTSITDPIANEQYVTGPGPT
jgi:hypothetical protein